MRYMKLSRKRPNLEILSRHQHAGTLTLYSPLVDFKEFQMATDDNEADERNRAKSIPLGLIRLIIFIYISSILHSGGGPFGGWGGR